MIYICEKCDMVYNAEYQPTEHEPCGCTYIHKADERGVLEAVGSMLLNTEESVLLKEAKSGGCIYENN